MLGSAKPRRLDEPLIISLEDLVPADRFSRHLEAMLDLDFVREWARRRYAERGRYDAPCGSLVALPREPSIICR